jgi:hypothetical protein
MLQRTLLGFERRRRLGHVGLPALEPTHVLAGIVVHKTA